MNWVQAVAAIALVFGLLALVYWLANRAAIPGLGRGQRLIRVIERHPLGDKRMLMLVEVGEETYLIGSTSQNISLVSVIRAHSVSAARVDSNEELSAPRFSKLLEMLK